MTTCPSCKYSVRAGVLRCANCGRSFDETSGATAFLPGADDKPPSIHSTESADGARFAITHEHGLPLPTPFNVDTHSQAVHSICC